MLEELRAIHNITVSTYKYAKKRYLYSQINWENRAICITGPRWVGKTTLLIQHYHSFYRSSQECLYISADNINVISYGLYNTIRDHFKYGGKSILIDEIHKYSNWSQEIKNCIDIYRNKYFVISGSSSLDLKKSKYDLSRRLVFYELTGFSFREYLYFVHDLKYSCQTLDSIIQNNISLSEGIASKIPVLKYFSDYLFHGYYPFILEGKKEYYLKVLNCIEKVLFEDIAIVFNVQASKLPILKKMLWLISTSNPFIPNISGMSSNLGISKEYVYIYIEFLEMAGIIINIRSNTKGAKYIRKPGKIYFDNTNIPVSINGSIKKTTQIGTLRETFFLNQLKSLHLVELANNCDFIVDHSMPFEIGGKNKKAGNALLALDEIEIGSQKIIPLYLFGFLY